MSIDKVIQDIVKKELSSNYQVQAIVDDLDGDDALIKAIRAALKAEVKRQLKIKESK